MRGRQLSAGERDFLQHYFGDALDCGPIRVAAAPGRRSWSPWGAQIHMAHQHFVDGSSRHEVRLSDPVSAAVFAHEAIHVWQRQYGRHVTREGAYLQTLYTLGLFDPYAYDRSVTDPRSLAALFAIGSIEQQGRIFQDYVYADRTGADTSRYAAVARWVRGAAQFWRD